MGLILGGLVSGLVPYTSPQAEAIAAVQRCFETEIGCLFCYSLIVLPNGTVKTSTQLFC